MGKRTSYEPGTFSWAELATSDAGAAKAFYTRVFGWDYEDNPIGDGQVYSMATRDGETVAALFASDQPPHWNCYVTVASVDESTERAANGGAQVMAEPFDVMDVGRMSVIVDPGGAALSLWEARLHPGATLINQPGALTWNDLLTPDVEAAARFYGELFAWETEEMPDAGGYRIIRNRGRSNGGMMAIDPERMGAGVPPQWVPYFGHEDVGHLVEEVGGLGGQVFNGPVQMAAGTIALLGDPQGAGFAVWTGHYDD